MSNLKGRQVSVEEAIERSQVRLPAIELSKTDIALLAAMYVYRDIYAEEEIDENAFSSLHWRVHDILGYAHDSKHVHATLKRFRSMELLSCIEGREMAYGVDASYSLSPLAQAIAKHAVGTEEITALSLEIILGKITSEVIAIAEHAQKGLTPEEWDILVSEPFNVHINELFTVINARQSEMDKRTEEVRDKVSRRLSESWFDAVDECIDMLDIIMINLDEINKVYSKHTAQVTESLEIIAERALLAGQKVCCGQARQILGSLDRLVGWSDKKLTGWIRYHGAVTSYISDLVRTDPQRKRSKQMMVLIQRTVKRPFVFTHSVLPRVKVLRDEVKMEKRAKIVRSVNKVEAESESEKAQIIAFIDRTIVQAKVGDKLDLVTTARLLADELPNDQLWKALGLLPGRVLLHGGALSRHQRGWFAVGDFMVENIEVHGRGDNADRTT